MSRGQLGGQRSLCHVLPVQGSGRTDMVNHGKGAWEPFCDSRRKPSVDGLGRCWQGSGGYGERQDKSIAKTSVSCVLSFRELLKPFILRWSFDLFPLAVSRKEVCVFIQLQCALPATCPAVERGLDDFLRSLLDFPLPKRPSTACQAQMTSRESTMSRPILVTLSHRSPAGSALQPSRPSPIKQATSTPIP